MLYCPSSSIDLSEVAVVVSSGGWSADELAKMPEKRGRAAYDERERKAQEGDATMERMTHEQLVAAKKAAALNLEKIARLCSLKTADGSRKYTMKQIEEGKGSGVTLKALLESPVGFGLSHTAAACGFVDPNVAYEIFGTKKGTQMAVGALVEIREKTGKSVGWFNPPAINAMLDTLSEVEVKSLTPQRPTSLLELAEADSNRQGPVEFLRRFARKRDGKRGSNKGGGETEQLNVDTLDEELETGSELDSLDLGAEELSGTKDEKALLIEALRATGNARARKLADFSEKDEKTTAEMIRNKAKSVSIELKPVVKPATKPAAEVDELG